MSSVEEEESDTCSVGIDLGTTYSCVAVYEDSEWNVIVDSTGETRIPSVVCFSQNGITVGATAKNQRILYPKDYIYNSKRFLGRRYSEINITEQWGYDIVNFDGDVAFNVNLEKHLSPVRVSEELLKYIKLCAEDYTGKTVKKAVITVPARFNHVQRQATLDAAKHAGFDDIFLLNEPTAAALAFFHDLIDTKEKHVVVYDFGGGTFDVSVLRIQGRNFTALAACGDAHLGGADIDQLLAQFCLKKWMDQYPNLNLTGEEQQQLLHLCESAKKGLSDTDTKHFDLYVNNLTNPLGMDLNLEDLKREAKSIFEKTISLTNEAIASARLDRSQVNHVVVVGGSSRIPYVRELLSSYFTSDQLSYGLDEDLAVAIGAAKLAHDWNQRAEIRDFVIQEFVSSSLGLKTYDDKMLVVIPRGERLPTTKDLKVTTLRNLQTQVNFFVLEGECDEAAGNSLLGNVVLSNLKPAPAGQLKLRIQFTFNVNSMLTVMAYDEETGEKQEVALNCYGALSMHSSAELSDTGNRDSFIVSNESNNVCQ
ncbi:Heat shock protein SSB1 [Fasciolopsis buskii]|uniref:Heat shock protein SSB1 n=1 Tax=Fasciolopsis buskii TaxID=27845 RepID=A0A8E0S453_9TREM|nr:Heat shock protein SSB1 [Fasciolopsis buski]